MKHSDEVIQALNNISVELNKLDSYLNSLNFVKDVLPLIIAVVVALLGGWLTYIFQKRDTTEKIKSDLKYEVYRKIIILHKKAQDNLATLMNLTINLPFIMMESCLILGDVTQDPEHIQHGKEDALKRWGNYLDEFMVCRDKVSNDYIELLYLIADWEFILKDLGSSSYLFKEEVTKIINFINEHISKIICLDRAEWRNWDRVVMEEEAKQVHEEVVKFSCYLSDLRVIIHNASISKTFDCKKKFRQPTSQEYLVLTKDGFKTPEEIRLLNSEI